ncbi:MAG: sodium:proton antiporter [Alphaproteobacteria bacterium]|nr:sodium:proton antiporter [Alphaproteobacteria bacterium]
MFAQPALASETRELPGAAMSLWWALPFAGLLLSIATGPLLFHHVWEHHYGKIAAAWAALVVVPLVVAFGLSTAGGAVLRTLLTEYMSFIILLFALYTISGGVLLAGNIHGTPLVNAGLLLAGVIGAILLSASWKPGISVSVLGVGLELQNLTRDAVILALAFLSLRVSHKSHRQANGFTWGPIAEVAKLFAGIFVCIVPVIAILRAGHEGALAPLVALVSTAGGQPNDLAYFWLTGALSSFLDNAPTYLVFFELAGGDARHLMTEAASTLAAISAGAVFMGANTYIGNAPNFMVFAIARHRGFKMPGFFGYMAWSGLVLIPTFLVAGFLFFR